MRESVQAWTGGRGDASVAALTQSAVNLAWRFLSLVCYAQFRSVVVSLQSPFQHTTDLENDHSKDFTMTFVEGRRTKLKDQANMHKVFRHCFAKSHQGQLFS